MISVNDLKRKDLECHGSFLDSPTFVRARWRIARGKPRGETLPPRNGFDLAPGLFLRIVQEETFLNVPKMPYHDGLRGVLRGDKIAKAAAHIRAFNNRKGVRAQLRRLLDWHGPGSLVAMLQDVMTEAGFPRTSVKLEAAFDMGCTEEEALEAEGKFSW